jgi:hypothetical protein
VIGAIDLLRVRKMHDYISVLTFPSLYAPLMVPESVRYRLRVCGVVGKLPSDLLVIANPVVR